jgi:hypothetical protein
MVIGSILIGKSLDTKASKAEFVIKNDKLRNVISANLKIASSKQFTIELIYRGTLFKTKKQLLTRMKIKKMLLSSIRPVAGQMYSAQEKRL